MRKKIDLLVWKYLVPALRQDSFRYRFVQLAAMVYIRCFAMPRNFLRHYFEGRGSAVRIDGAELIHDNPHLPALIRDKVGQQDHGCIQLSQSVLTDPRWKYSLGSFVLHFKRQAGGLELKLESRYQYQQDTPRLTRHLHRWLSDHQNAKAFPVYSEPFHIADTQLNAACTWADLRTIAPFAYYLLV